MKSNENIKQYIDHLKFMTDHLNERDEEIKKLNKELNHRLLVLSKPPGEMDDLKLVDVIDIDLLQEIQDEFSRSFEIASIIYDENGVPITKPSNFSDFCILLRTSKIGLHRCELSKKRHGEVSFAAGGKPILDACMNFPELMDGTITITIEGNKVGSLCAGQKLVEPLSEERIREYAKEIDIDPDELYEASKKLPRDTIEHFQKIVDFLHVICKTISILGLQNIMQAREISKRMDIQKDLEEYEKNYFSIFKMARDIFLIYKLNGDIVAANDRACEAYGYPLEKMLQLNAKQMVEPSHYHLFKKAVEDIKVHKKFYTSSTEVRKDGTTFDMDVHAVRIQYMGIPHLLAIIQEK